VKAALAVAGRNPYPDRLMLGTPRRPLVALLVAAVLLLGALGLSGDAFGRALSTDISVAVIGPGAVTGPGGLNCREDASSGCTASVANGSTVTLVATPDGGASFDSWDNDCDGSAPTCTLTAQGGEIDTRAIFTPGGGGGSGVVPLTVTVAGSGTVTGGGISCGAGATTCTQNETTGASIVLTATPSAGASFTGWGGACSGAAPTCTVPMTAAQNVTASFATAGTGSFPLTVTVAGNGKVTGGGIDCGAGATTCTAAEPANASVTLTATPAAGTAFAGWGGACSGVAVTCTVAMTAAMSAQAQFATQVSSTATLALTVTGRGTVTTTPGTPCASSGAKVSCKRSYAMGTAVRLTPKAGAGASFVRWTGACSGRSACTVVMSSSRSVGATFSAVPLTVASLGAPVAVRSTSFYRLTVRFRTSKPGQAHVSLLHALKLVDSLSRTVRAGSVRLGPLLAPEPGRYTLVLSFTDAARHKRTLRWSTCLGACPKP
jgi:List-Bact-rpt repeat protein